VAFGWNILPDVYEDEEGNEVECATLVGEGGSVLADLRPLPDGRWEIVSLCEPIPPVVTQSLDDARIIAQAIAMRMGGTPPCHGFPLWDSTNISEWFWKLAAILEQEGDV
jgi:hypothetical protein